MTLVTESMTSMAITKTALSSLDITNMLDFDITTLHRQYQNKMRYIQNRAFLTIYMQWLIYIAIKCYFLLSQIKRGS